MKKARQPQRARLAGVIGVVALLAVAFLAVAVGRQVASDLAFRPIRVPAQSAPPPAAVAALTALVAEARADQSLAEPPTPSAAGIQAVLSAPLRAPGLGSKVSAEVFDAATATPLLRRAADTTVAPASTAKLLVAAAILTVRKPTDRFVTRVVEGTTPNTVVLVGGGDPTLSAATNGVPACVGAALVSELAARVKKSLAGRPVTQVVVDSSIFSGPATAPGWAPEDAPSTYAAPITATMIDGGRPNASCDPSDARSGAPDLVAGGALAAALDGAHVSRGTAPAGARVLGQVQSAPINRLVEQMLSESDNVIAEVLARQVAIAIHRPASFSEGASAVRAILSQRLGIEVGAGMKDGSGLSYLDRVPASALSAVLLKAFDPAHPELHPIVSALSVAGWDGTLLEQDRFHAHHSAYGAVRAKTGSLSANGVHSLIGVVSDKDGRTLVFSFIADKAPDQDTARAALDNLAATLADCGCR